MPFPIACSHTRVYSVVLVNRLCVIASDLLVLVTTWVFTHRERKAMRVLHVVPLVDVFWKTGMLYFTIMLALNIAGISLWNSGFIELVSGAIGPLTSLMVSHCLLNLREVIALPQDIADITSLSFAHSELQVAAHEVDSSTGCTSDSTISMEMEPIESSHGARTSDSLHHVPV